MKWATKIELWRCLEFRNNFMDSCSPFNIAKQFIRINSHRQNERKIGFVRFECSINELAAGEFNVMKFYEKCLELSFQWKYRSRKAA